MCDELIRSEGGQPLAAAQRILGNLEDAQDAVQEGFLDAFSGLDGFDGRARVSTWLFRVVMNLAETPIEESPAVVHRLRPSSDVGG